MAHDLGLVSWEETAGPQRGVITVAAALGSGMSRSEIRWRLTTGRWQQPMRDVLVTHPGPISRIEWMWCAVESIGRDAVLGGASAACLDGLCGYEEQQITVLVPADRRITPRPGVVVRRTARLQRSDIQPLRLPRRTRLPRSLIDMAEWAPRREDACALLVAAVEQRVVSVGALRLAVRLRGPISRRTLISETLDDLEAAAVVDLLRGRPEPAAEQVVAALRQRCRRDPTAEEPRSPALRGGTADEPREDVTGAP
jgi:hypothetical protein